MQEPTKQAPVTRRDLKNEPSSAACPVNAKQLRRLTPHQFFQAELGKMRAHRKRKEFRRVLEKRLAVRLEIVLKDTLEEFGEFAESLLQDFEPIYARDNQNLLPQKSVGDDSSKIQQLVLHELLRQMRKNGVNSHSKRSL